MDFEIMWKEKIWVNLCFLIVITNAKVQFTNSKTKKCSSDFMSQYGFQSDLLALKIGTTNLTVTYELPFISHCDFDIQFENGTKVPEESFQIKTSIGKSSSNDYIVVGKNVEGKFSAKFSDGSSKDFYLYYRSKNETVASYNTTLQDTFEKTIGKKSCLKILYSSQFVVSSKKSNFEISLNFKLFI